MNAADEENELLSLSYNFLMLGTMYLMWRRTKRRERRFRVHPYLTKRETHGACDQIVEELYNHDDEYFLQYTRMTKDQFKYVVELVKPHLTRQATRLQKPVTPEEWLMVTLRYLATGESQNSLSFQYRMERTTVSQTILATCQVLWNVLSPIYLPSPNEEVFARSADRFQQLWNFPNCIGAVDQKQVRITCPQDSGSESFNSEKYLSIALLGVCDADYRFTVIDIGSPGRADDDELFPVTALERHFETELPEPKNLPDTKIVAPHFLVADVTFPSRVSIMKPYRGNQLDYRKRVFNYRLSRARRTIENTFGILVARWRILETEINASLETSQAIIKATCCLHNYLRTESMESGMPYCPPLIVDQEDPVTHTVFPGEWRSLVVDDEPKKSTGKGQHAYTRRAARVRDVLSKYFVSETGSVPWQDSVVTNAGYEPVQN